MSVPDLRDFLAVEDDVVLFKALGLLQKALTGDLSKFQVEDAISLIEELAAQHVSAADIDLIKAVITPAITGTLTPSDVLDALIERFGGGLAPYRPLVHPLNNLGPDTFVSWSLFDLPGLSNGSLTHEITSGDWKIALDARAGLDFSFVANAAAPAGSEAVPAGRALVAVGLGAALELNASGSGPLYVLDVSVKAAASGSGAIRYVFGAPEGQIFGLAVADAINRLPAPFDLDEVRQALGGLTHPLYGLSLEHARGLSLDASIVIGKSYQLGNQAALDVALKVAWGIKLAGKAKAEVGRPSPGVLSLAVIRESSQTFSDSLGLSVAIDFSELAASIGAMLEKNGLGEFTELLGKVKPYLTPGTLIQDKLRKTLKTQFAALGPNKSKALLVLVGLGDGKPEDALASYIAGQLDTGKTKLSASAGAMTDSLLTGLFRRLPQILDEDMVKTAIKTALDQEVDTLVTGLSDAVKAKLEPISQDLGKAGVQLQAGLSRLDTALVGVRKVLNQYLGVIDKIVTELKSGANAKLMLDISSTRLRERGTDKDIEILLLDGGDENLQRKAFQATLAGNLTAVIKAANKDPEHIKLKRGSVIEQVADKQGDLVSVSLLHFTGSGGSVLDAETQIIHTVSGNVIIDTVKSRNTFKNYWRALNGETREARFTNIFEWVSTDVERPLSPNFTLVHDDPNFEPEEAAGFLQQMETLGLIGQGTAASAARFVREKAGASAARVNGRLDVVMQLRPTDVTRLIDRRVVTREAVFSNVYAALGAAEVVGYSQAKLRQAAETLARDATDRSSPVAVLMTADPRPYLFAFTGTANREMARWLGVSPLASTLNRYPPPGQGLDNIHAALRVKAAAESIWQFIRTLEEIRTAKPKGLGNASGWSAGDYEDRQIDLDRFVSGWLVAIGDLVDAINPRQRARRRNVAFLHLFAQLLLLDDPVKVLLTLRDGDGEVTRVL